MVVYFITVPPTDSSSSFSSLHSTSPTKNHELFQKLRLNTVKNKSVDPKLFWIKESIDELIHFRRDCFLDNKYWIKFIDNHEKKVNFEVWKAKARAYKSSFKVIKKLQHNKKQLLQFNPPQGLFFEFFPCFFVFDYIYKENT